MHRLRVLAWLWLALLAAAPTMLMAPTSQGEPKHPPQAAGVIRATDLVKQWQPRSTLYLQGDVGVAPTCSTNSKHGLTLARPIGRSFSSKSATGESYTDASGQAFSGLDAVEHALGKGLPSQTAFGQLLDPRTQERNGAFFILFLKDRKFSYYGSDAQDRRGLGEDRWQARSTNRPSPPCAAGAALSMPSKTPSPASIVNSIDASRRRSPRASKSWPWKKPPAPRPSTRRRRPSNQPPPPSPCWNEKAREFNQQHPGLSGEVARPPTCRGCGQTWLPLNPRWPPTSPPPPPPPPPKLNGAPRN